MITSITSANVSTMSHSHSFFSSVVKTIKISSPGSWGEGWEEGIVREFGMDKTSHLQQPLGETSAGGDEL